MGTKGEFLRDGFRDAEESQRRTNGGLLGRNYSGFGRLRGFSIPNSGAAAHEECVKNVRGLIASM
jgi:hypothetical protein